MTTLPMNEDAECRQLNEQKDGVPMSPDRFSDLQIVLSFDVEEHDRIEAARELSVDSETKLHYAERMDVSTRWLLEELGKREIKATFFMVGEIAKSHPDLIRAIHSGGHELASHSWDHQRVHQFTPETFREDVRKSKDALEQITGEAVVGFRAPTFSVMRETHWALDILAELGFRYDSSIFPVRHDRYGVPKAPRMPFLAKCSEQTLLELPPATLRICGANLPVGGGGYFRLFPLAVLKIALRQIRKRCMPAVAMLYFHPWEFDPDQLRLPLPRVSRFRTYVGVKKTRRRLGKLLERYQFSRAIDVAESLLAEKDKLPTFSLESSD